MTDRIAEYWRRVEETAKAMETDGCSKVADAYVHCCWEHDIAWRTGKTVNGQPQSLWQTTVRFWRCIRSSSRLGPMSPMAWWRAAGTFAYGAISRSYGKGGDQ